MNSKTVHESIDDLIEFLNSGDKELLRPPENNIANSQENHMIFDPILNTNTTATAALDRHGSAGITLKEKDKENIENDFLIEFQKKIDRVNTDKIVAAIPDPTHNIMTMPEPSLSLNLKGLRHMKFRPLRYEKDSTSSGPKEIKDYGYYFRFQTGEVKLIRNLLEDNGFKESPNNDWTIYWSCGPIKADVYTSLSPYQKVNHFPKSIEITRKDLMYRNIGKMQGRYGMKHYNFVPKTFILPHDYSLLKDDSEKYKNNKFYIAKPSALSQGKGIYVTNKIEDILQRSNVNYVVSHYIEDPFLINGLKFDMRIYVIISSINPLRIYLYDEGLARFATEKYDCNSNSKGNRYIHLTNYSVNKNSENFQANSDPVDDFTGSKWSLTSLQAYLKSLGIDVQSVFDDVEELIVKTIISIESVLYSSYDSHVPYRNNCFDLLGFDILLDSKLKPWLLEVNLSPSMNCDSPLDLKIKGELIADIFTMIGILPLDQRLYQNLPYNKSFNIYCSNGAPPPEKKSDWNSSWGSGGNSNSGGGLIDPNNSKREFTKEERMVLKETEDELKRARNMKRIYPDANCMKYKTFFEVDRPFNALLRNKEIEIFKEKYKPVKAATVAVSSKNATILPKINNRVTCGIITPMPPSGGFLKKY